MGENALKTADDEEIFALQMDFFKHLSDSKKSVGAWSGVLSNKSSPSAIFDYKGLIKGLKGKNLQVFLERNRISTFHEKRIDHISALLKKYLTEDTSVKSVIKNYFDEDVIKLINKLTPNDKDVLKRVIDYLEAFNPKLGDFDNTLLDLLKDSPNPELALHLLRNKMSVKTTELNKLMASYYSKILNKKEYQYLSESFDFLDKSAFSDSSLQKFFIDFFRSNADVKTKNKLIKSMNSKISLIEKDVEMVKEYNPDIYYMNQGQWQEMMGKSPGTVGHDSAPYTIKIGKDSPDSLKEFTSQYLYRKLKENIDSIHNSDWSFFDLKYLTSNEQIDLIEHLFANGKIALDKILPILSFFEKLHPQYLTGEKLENLSQLYLENQFRKSLKPGERAIPKGIIGSDSQEKIIANDLDISSMFNYMLTKDVENKKQYELFLRRYPGIIRDFSFVTNASDETQRYLTEVFTIRSGEKANVIAGLLNSVQSIPEKKKLSNYLLEVALDIKASNNQAYLNSLENVALSSNDIKLIHRSVIEKLDALKGISGEEAGRTINRLKNISKDIIISQARKAGDNINEVFHFAEKLGESYEELAIEQFVLSIGDYGANNTQRVNSYFRVLHKLSLDSDNLQQLYMLKERLNIGTHAERELRFFIQELELQVQPSPLIQGSAETVTDISQQALIPYSKATLKPSLGSSAYKILGVSENATEQEIKRQYAKLAKKYHPDVLGGDAESFKIINEAYAEVVEKNQQWSGVPYQVNSQDLLEHSQKLLNQEN